jgi:hypothetical protein
MLPLLTGGIADVAVFSDEFGYLSIGAPSIAFAVPPIWGVWYFALYKAAAARSLIRPSTSAFPAALVLYWLTVCFAFALYYQRNEPPDWLLATVRVLIFPTVALLCGCVWLSASMLVSAENQASDTNKRSAVGTTFMLFYLPFAIWALHGRIKDMLSKPIIAAAER